MRAGMAVVEPELVGHARMHWTQECYAFGDHGVDVEDLGMHFRLARKL
jgi:hypothetical protein